MCLNALNYPGVPAGDKFDFNVCLRTRTATAPIVPKSRNVPNTPSNLNTTNIQTSSNARNTPKNLQ